MGRERTGEQPRALCPCPPRPPPTHWIRAKKSARVAAAQTSLAQFTALYEGAIDGAERAASAARRAANITDRLTSDVYAYAQRGLFERHKLVFALMLTNKVLLSAGGVTSEEVEALLKMGGTGDGGGGRKKPKVGRCAAKLLLAATPAPGALRNAAARPARPSL